ncbi:chloride channel [Aureococcus anophagefferens]|nr:chloride channel [Aureococcus anophagefferens]
MLMRRIASLSFATSLGRARGLGRNAHKSCVRRFAAGKQGGAFPPGPEQWDSWTEIGFGVPIVEIDGLVLTESAVVVEYLAEKDGPGPFYLEDHARRAAARLMAEVHPFGDYFKFLKLRDDPEALAAAVADLTGKLEVFEAFLVKHGDAAGPFFNGEDLCYAEANLAPFLQRMVPTLKHYVDVDVRRLCEPFPRVDRLVSAVLARWTVRKTGVPEDKLIEGMDRMLARIAAQAPPP